MSTRIAKFLADAGIASRRGAEDIIAQGRVTINGRVIDSPVNFVNDTDIVAVDGRTIDTRVQTEIYMFYKPINTVTTTSDPQGRKTIYDCLPDKYKQLKYIGRLDYKTTGLLLMTNDGDLARKLTLPSSGVPRTYIANVNQVNPDGVARATKGVSVDGIKYAPMKINVIDDKTLRITICEGKKNEIRIVMRKCGMPVQKLHRISYGNVELKNIKIGEIKKLSQKTIDEIKKSL